MNSQKRYEHHCDKCLYLARHVDIDLYYCEGNHKNGVTTFTIRYSDVAADMMNLSSLLKIKNISFKDSTKLFLFYMAYDLSKRFYLI